MMDLRGSGSWTWAEPGSTSGHWYRASDSSAFSFTEVKWTPAASASDSSAFPGEVLTEAVADNVADRRVLSRVLRKLAKDAAITRSTLMAAKGFLDALPRAKRLPTVSPDGEGGIALAWSVPGQGRTVVTVADGVLYVVGNAGTLQSVYLPDIDFTGTLSDELLVLIPE